MLEKENRKMLVWIVATAAVFVAVADSASIKAGQLNSVIRSLYSQSVRSSISKKITKKHSLVVEW